MKADALHLVDLLGGALADPAAVDRRYRDAVLAVDAAGDWLATITLLEHGVGTPSFETDDGTLRVLGVAYDDQQLAPERVSALEACSPGWRDRRGTPQAYVVEDENDRAFRLFPTPDAASDSSGAGVFGEPFGRDFPLRGIAVFATVEADDLPVEFDLPIALLALAREAAGDSDHRDPMFADAAAALAGAMLDMVR